MKRTLICLITSIGFSAVAETPTKLELIRKIPHSGYSEGLDFHQGYLWNPITRKTQVVQFNGSSEEKRESIIMKIDPQDGTVLNRFIGPTKESESIKWIKGVPVHVSFTDNGIYAGQMVDGDLRFKRVGTTPEDHAWGLEYDGRDLIMTGNYSEYLYFFDPKTYKKRRQLKTEMRDIEDLAWDGKRMWASSFTQKQSQIFPIDLKTGKVGPFYLIPEPELCPVVDGLAYDGKGLWITGKECPAIWYVKLPK